MATIIKITKSELTAIAQWDDDGAHPYDIIYQVVPDSPYDLDNIGTKQGGKGSESGERVTKDEAELMPAA